MSPSDGLHIVPIGRVENKYDDVAKASWGKVRSFILINEKFEEALKGLADFSHIFVLGWLHLFPDDLRNRTSAFPRGDSTLPELGSFALRGARPNPISVTVCKLLKIEKNKILVEGLDLVNNTPVLDIKPYIPEYDSNSAAGLPEWAYEN